MGMMSSMPVPGSCTPSRVSKRKRAVSWPKRSDAPCAPCAIIASASSTMFCHRAMLLRAGMPSLMSVSPLQMVMRSLLASCTASISSGVKMSQRLMRSGMSCMSLAMVCSSLSSFAASATFVASLNRLPMKRSVPMVAWRRVRAVSAFSSADS